MTQTTIETEKIKAPEGQIQTDLGKQTQAEDSAVNVDLELMNGGEREDEDQLIKQQSGRQESRKQVLVKKVDAEITDDLESIESLSMPPQEQLQQNAKKQKTLILDRNQIVMSNEQP